jgi:hypothetical protein
MMDISCRKDSTNTEKTSKIKFGSLAGLPTEYCICDMEIRFPQAQGASLGFSLSDILMFKEDVVVLLAIGVFT